MGRTLQILLVTIILTALVDPLTVTAQKSRHALNKKKPHADSLPGVLWREPKDLTSRNLYDGPGGREHAPKGRLIFIKEDHDGSNPKFVVRDEQGGKWKVKLGQEARSETAATRLVWAAGYFTDEDYYVPVLKVEDLKRLSRGQEFVAPDGTIRGARLERDRKGEKKIDHWSWFENPFVGTREMNGLKVMMALINNWDLKEDNNGIYEEKNGERRFVVTDLGATFGRTGNTLTRSRGVTEDYIHSGFIHKVRPDRVDFVLHSRPFFLLAVNVPYYCERTRMESIVKDIPRADARWLGQLLARLSDQQISDAFRAAGYALPETEACTRTLRQRITALTKL